MARPPRGETVERALLDKFRQIYAAVQRGDTPALQAELAHDIEWVFPDSLPWGGTHRGPLGVAAACEVREEYLGGFWIDPDDLLAVAGRVVILGRISGCARATGAPFEVPFAHVWTLNDGVPSALHAYFDTAPIAAALHAAQMPTKEAQ